MTGDTRWCSARSRRSTTGSGRAIRPSYPAEQMVAELEALLSESVVVDVSTQLFLAKKL
ncbi:hypothetical protein [Kribbella sancticallisti]